MDIVSIEIGRIMEPARPVRAEVDREHVARLAESIRTRGLRNPVTVCRRGELYEVVAGHHRLLACRALGLVAVDCLVVDVPAGDEEVESGTENLVRLQMAVPDEARLVAGLMAREGWGVAAAARALNHSEGWVRDRVGVLGWPADLLAGLSGGRISLGAAKALMGVEDERERDRLIQHALDSGVSVEVARRWRELANLEGRGVSQSINLAVGDAGAGPVLGSRMACFACGGYAQITEMVYAWLHRECAVSLAAALTEGRTDQIPESARPIPSEARP